MEFKWLSVGFARAIPWPSLRLAPASVHSHCTNHRQELRVEVNRYIGWPIYQVDISPFFNIGCRLIFSRLESLNCCPEAVVLKLRQFWSADLLQQQQSAAWSRCSFRTADSHKMKWVWIFMVSLLKPERLFAVLNVHNTLS